MQKQSRWRHLFLCSDWDFCRLRHRKHAEVDAEVQQKLETVTRSLQEELERILLDLLRRFQQFMLPTKCMIHLSHSAIFCCLILIIQGHFIVSCAWEISLSERVNTLNIQHYTRKMDTKILVLTRIFPSFKYVSKLCKMLASNFIRLAPFQNLFGPLKTDH